MRSAVLQIALIKIKVVRHGRDDVMKTLQAPCKVQQALNTMGISSQFRVEMRNSAGMSLEKEIVMQAGEYTLQFEPDGESE